MTTDELMSFTTARKLRTSQKILGFARTTIDPDKTVQLIQQPQWIFKPRRLVIPQRYPSLMLVDFRVGASSQLVTSAGIAIDTFATDEKLQAAIEMLAKLSAKGPAGAEELLKVREELEQLNNNLPGETCQIGQLIALHVLNIGKEPVSFLASMIGTAVE